MGDCCLGRPGFYLTLKTLFSATFQTQLVPAEKEDVCTAIVLRRVETRVSKLKDVREGQKEERKLSKCNVYSRTQWALRCVSGVVLCSDITVLYLNWQKQHVWSLCHHLWSFHTISTRVRVNFTFATVVYKDIKRQCADYYKNNLCREIFTPCMHRWQSWYYVSHQQCVSQREFTGKLNSRSSSVVISLNKMHCAIQVNLRVIFFSNNYYLTNLIISISNPQTKLKE